MRYDLIVLGSSPAAHETALAAGRLRQNVAWIEPEASFSNLWRLSAVAMARQLRQAVELVVPRPVPRERGGRTLDCCFARLVATARAIEASEQSALARRLERLQIDRFTGAPHFVDSHSVFVDHPGEPQVLEAEFIVVGTGTVVRNSPAVPFDGDRVLSADDVPTLARVPRSLLIVGASHTGVELALLFALLGTRVTLVDRQRQIQNPGTARDGTMLVRQLQGLGVRLLTDTEVVGVNTDAPRNVRVELLSGECLSAERVLWTTEREGATASLGLSALGVRPDDHGRLWCDNALQTWQPTILGIGDVVGHPNSLAVAPDSPRNLVWNALRGNSRGLDAFSPLARDTVLSPVS